MKQIVIATDGSASAWTAVEEGVELASGVGAGVTFVTVRHGVTRLGDPLYQRQLTAQLERARAALTRAGAEAERLGVPYDTEILEGDAASCIATAACAHEADLVVVGSRGHGALPSAPIGSVSRALTSRCRVPVMIVRERSHPRVAA